MNDEERALHLQKELNVLEEQLAEAKETRVREKKLADAKHLEWERRIRDAERGMDGKWEMQARLTQMEFELEAERAKSTAREVLKTHRKKQKAEAATEAKKTLASQVDAAVKSITSSLEARAPKRGYGFNSFQSDVHNMMQALGRRNYLDKYAGKKVAWGSKPLDLAVSPPARNEEQYAQWKAQAQWEQEKEIWTAKAQAEARTALQDEPAPPPDNTWVDGIMSTQAIILKARDIARDNKRRSAKRFGIGALLNQ